MRGSKSTAEWLLREENPGNRKLVRLVCAAMLRAPEEARMAADTFWNGKINSSIFLGLEKVAVLLTNISLK